MMNLKELAEFCRRMGVGLRAGVDILRVIQNEQKIGRAAHQQAMTNVYAQIRAGDTLADAMKAQGKHFPKLLIQMVHASELGGRTDSIFTYMAGYYEQLKQTRSAFLQKISWPLIQLGLAVGIIGVVILIQGILSPNTTYDASAMGFRGVGGFVSYCVIVTCVFSVAGLAIYGIWKNWFQCHSFLTPIVQRIPQLGTALITLSMSRLSMTLSMLLNAGVDAKHAVKQAFLSTGNQYFIDGMDRAVSEIDRGASFGDAFEKSEVLPDDFVDAIRIGEISGTETESLDHLATEYQHRAASALNTIATIASLAVWIGIMIFIGFIVLRMAFQYVNLINKAVNDPMGDW
jgi:type IV pilus assembly protein PilC